MARSYYKDIAAKIDQLYEKINNIERKVDKHDILIDNLKTELSNIKRDMKLNTLMIRYVIPLMQAILITIGLVK